MTPSPKVFKTHSTAEAISSAEPTRETSEPALQLSWHRDQEHDSNKKADFELGSINKTFVTEPTRLLNTGPYYSERADDVAQIVKNQGDFIFLNFAFT